MKRFLMRKVFVVMVLTMLIQSTALAEGIDLEGMDYEYLTSLKQLVDKELYSRPESAPRVLTPGSYIVGKDIKAGRYNFLVNTYEFDVPAVAWLGVYENIEAYNADCDPLHYGYFSIGDEQESIDLCDGNLVKIVDFPITLSISEITEDESFNYITPDGTYVPRGLYIGGEDIPIGKYRIYMGTLSGGDVLIFSDKTSYSEGEYDARAELLPIWSGHIDYIIVEEGNIVEVRKDVVMVRQEELDF